MLDFTDHDIRSFLIRAHLAGYAAGDSARKTKEVDGSTTLVFEQGDWRYHDNYFGGEPYGGREVVFFRGKPVWMMVYYGGVLPSVKDLKPIYAFLQHALRNMPDNMPCRGPEFFDEGVSRPYIYKCSVRGSFVNFSGEEQIIEYAFRQVYFARFQGGLVDLRQ